MFAQPDIKHGQCCYSSPFEDISTQTLFVGSLMFPYSVLIIAKVLSTFKFFSYLARDAARQIDRHAGTAYGSASTSSTRRTLAIGIWTY